MQGLEQIIEGYRLSPQQKQLWRLLRDNQPYNAGCAILIEGNLRTDLLETVLKKIFQRHEILRTTLDWFPGLETPIQVILDNPPLPYERLHIYDHQTKGIPDDESMKRELWRLNSLPFELKHRILTRFYLTRRSALSHILFIHIHAICADGATLKNLFEEIARLYRAECEGKESTDEPVQYLQFSEWENELLEEGQAGIANSGSSANLTRRDLFLPQETKVTDSSELWARRFAPETISFRIDKGVADKIEAYCEQQDKSVSAFLLACWQILLWRLSLQEEIVVDCLFNGRLFNELRDGLGLFAFYIPVQRTMGEGLRFEEAVERAENALEEATARHEFHLYKMQYGEERKRIGAIGFEYEVWPISKETGALTFTYLEQSVLIDRFKLKLGARRKPDHIEIELEYDPACYSKGTIGLVQERYLKLIESGIGSRQKQIGEVEFIGEKEREKLVVEWNKTERVTHGARLIHERIREQAEEKSDSIAVTYMDEAISYREFEARSNQLARHLITLGAGPDRVVGLYLERSIEMMIGLIGILKSNGAYLPVDPGQPVRRIRLMLEDAGAELIVTKEYLSENLNTDRCKVIPLDKSWDEISNCRREAPLIEAHPENLAYVIFTSGSTGNPKGVMVRHASVVNLLDGLSDTIYKGSSDDLKVCLNAPISFDSSVKQVIQLAKGRTLCLAPEDARLEPATMLDYVRTNEIEALDCTPSVLSLLVEAGLRERPGSLKIVLVGGEAIDPQSWNDLSESREVEYFNVYGPTECTVDATLCAIEGDRTPTIGRPIQNVQIYILSPDGSLAPLGADGEIYIGGDGLARGYIGEAKLTAEKFLPDVFSGRDGQRLYRTGDFGRYTTDGEIIFSGRSDDQVKMRGVRIELSEIAAVLKTCSGVNDVVVVLREDAPGQKRLVGYIVRKDGAAGASTRYVAEGQGVTESKEIESEESVGESLEEATPERLKQFMRESLPAYMTPAALIFMKELPLTQNGKIDRSALPKPEDVKGQAEDPKNGWGGDAYEEIVGGIWKDILKLEHIGRDDNFFEIGGHSLLATQVISRVRKTLGVEIGVRSIFENSTIESLAGKVEIAVRGKMNLCAPPLVKVDRRNQRSGAPLSFAQQRLWFLDQLAPNNPLYNNPHVLRVEGALDIDALEEAINEVVKRHETLRTRIDVEQGVPVQITEAWEPWKIEVIDLSSMSLEEAEEEAGKRAKEEASAGFDLSRGSLLRIKILRLEAQKYILLYTMHHIVSDAWSMEILNKEVIAFYQAAIAGDVLTLPELPIQYSDYAIWQREWLQGEALEEMLEYWRRRLSDIEELELPLDHPRPATPSYQGANRRFMIEVETAEKLRELTRREGVTLFMTMLAGFDIIMSRYSGQQDIILGTDIANRNQAEIEGLIGFFVNQLVLRVQVNPGENFNQLLIKVREVCLGAYAHQDAPFEKLVEELQPERDLSRSPLFQAKLIWQSARRESMELGDLKLEGGGGDPQKARFDLTVGIVDDGHSLIGMMNFNRDIFEEDTIDRLIRHYKIALGMLADAFDRPISELNLLSPAEIKQMVIEWNQTRSPYSNDQCIHELFQAQAERTPEQIAVHSEGHRLSYRELDRRANQLAAYLLHLGITTETAVGLCLERSVELIVAIVAALKAGAPYLPLDPEYPQERLALLLEDSAVRVVLTEARLEDRLPIHLGRNVCLDKDWGSIAQACGETPVCRPKAENLAYVLYTSGSTGRPKAVMASHRNLVNYTQAICSQLGIDDAQPGAGMHFAIVSTITADLGNTCIYPSLVSGGCLHVLNYETVTDGRLFKEYLEREPIDVLKITPPHFRTLLGSQPREAKIGPSKYLFLGGDALGYELVDRINEQNEGCEIINHYGPTETTVGCLTSVVKQQAPRRSMSAPIGRPIANSQAYVLDRDLAPIPIGVRGDLYIGGDGVSRGYLNNPDQTAERFIPDPFSCEFGGRLYRTGDLVRYLPDGKIEFMGRADDQVKVRGYRVELGEIQAAFNKHPGVKQSVVLARKDSRGDQRLIGYVVGDENVIPEALKSHLRESLPEYMTPETIITLDAMPITSNGKIDRKRLPDPANSRLTSEESFVQPRDLFEHKLAKIWESVLEVKPIGVRENFFELGGHSILAAILMARIQSEFGRELPLSALFQEGTIEQLGALLRTDAESFTWSCLVELQGEGAKPPLYIVHPGGGNVFGYFELAHFLGSERPVFAFQEPGLYNNQKLLTKIEDLAAHYIAAMQEVQPEGPYILGGWSLGGIIAFEMAQQLLNQGQQISQLILLDSRAPLDREESPVDGEDHDEKEEDAVLLMELFSGGLKMAKNELEPYSGDERIEFVLKRGVDFNIFPPDVTVSLARSYLAMFRSNSKAKRQYTPRVYPGAVTLFRTPKLLNVTSENVSGPNERLVKILMDPTMGWEQYAAEGVNVIEVPGHHTTMMGKPHVEILAKRIKDHLGEAELSVERRALSINKKSSL
jgi:amino acid adenylation domain-containing protein